MNRINVMLSLVGDEKSSITLGTGKHMGADLIILAIFLCGDEYYMGYAVVPLGWGEGECFCGHAH